MSLSKLHTVNAQFGGHVRVPVTAHTSIWFYASVRVGWKNPRN